MSKFAIFLFRSATRTIAVFTAITASSDNLVTAAGDQLTYNSYG